MVTIVSDGLPKSLPRGLAKGRAGTALLAMTGRGGGGASSRAVKSGVEPPHSIA